MILIYVIKCRTGKKYRNIVAADNCFTVGLKMACNGTACRSPGSECQERAAVNWLTFIPNQYTAALA
jgi:hypothetical protein